LTIYAQTVIVNHTAQGSEIHILHLNWIPVKAHAHTHIYIYIYIYIYTHTHIHTHTHIYIYIHTHTPLSVRKRIFTIYDFLFTESTGGDFGDFSQFGSGSKSPVR